MKLKIESYKPVWVAMFQNFIVFIFTYTITILCLFMFDNSAEIVTEVGAGNTAGATADALINTIAATTITYCLSIILKNLFITKRTMYVTIISIGLAIVYVLIYVSTIHGVMEDLVFWIGTLVLLAFSLASELEELIHAQTFANKKRYFEVFSA